MGTFTNRITLIALSGDRSETIEAIVDTGATFTSIPAPILESLGVVPEDAVRLRLVKGQIQERALGTVRAELSGVRRNILCLLREPEDPVLIGAHTLEGFLLAVDPVEKRLVPIEGLLL